MRISDWGSDVGSSDLTVRLQVGLAAKRAEFDNTEEVLSELGLMPYADRLAGDISYGDQRRVDLALTLVGRPKVLLLDEPAAGLTLEESLRSEERRVGKECVSTCSCRGSPSH